MPGVQKRCTNFETQIGGKKFPIKFAIILWKADCLLSRHPFFRPIPVGMGLLNIQPHHRMKIVRKGYYSPVLRRDLVRGLYFKARELGVPMTVLNDRIVEEALQCVTAIPFPSPKPSPQAVESAA